MFVFGSIGWNAKLFDFIRNACYLENEIMIK